MGQEQGRHRIFSYITKSRFLHVEDALNIGKVRLFAGKYTRGSGADVVTAHYVDVADARVLAGDLEWGKSVEHIEFKGTKGPSGYPPLSRVLKIKSKDGKVWFALQSGPGEVVGQGAIKPAGDPEVSVNVPLPLSDARRLGAALHYYLQAWEVVQMLARQPSAQKE